MSRQRLKSAFSRSAEVIFAILLVLVFFSILLVILNVFFPSGISIRTMMSQTAEGPPAPEVSTDIVPSPLDSGKQGSESEAIAAILTRAYNTVKSKRADAIAWSAAKVGMHLYDRDAVQTLNRSTALITFDANNYLSMGSNSLIIIKRLEQSNLTQEKRSFLVMVDGELRGKLAGSDQKSLQVEVTTPSGVARIQTKGQKKNQAEFKIAINPDKSSTISVYEGEAEITAQGKTIVVDQQHSTTVAMGSAPSDPRLLPDAVQLIAPAHGDTFFYRDLSPRVTFSWKKADGEKRYSFLLARDPQFHKLVLEERPSEPKCTFGNLKDGTYYWKVSVLDGGQEGLYSDTRRLRVHQDKEPPLLSVQFPPDIIRKSSYTLAGNAEPGSRVFVMGERVKVNAEGKFEHALKLHHGVNVIVVEAVDKAGNVAYKSKMVNGKF
ncbi:MAG: hypothetical protein ACM34I_03880 [bacterium]